MSSLDLLAKIAELVGRHPMPVMQGLVTGLTAQFLIAHTLGGHHDRLVKGAERWMRGGEPVAGLGTFRGRVVAQRDAAAERLVVRAHQDPKLADRKLQAPVVERVRTQRRINKDVWRDVQVTARAEPFRLELAEGRELSVVPGEPQLSGFEETEITRPEVMREVRSSVYPDEQVWVTGYLEPAPRGLGAYRGGGEPRKLRPPKGRRLWITRMAPAEGWKRLARAHRGAGWAALLALLASLGTAWKEVLSPWVAGGAVQMPRLPAYVLFAWLLFAALSLIAWRSWIVSARNAWTKRFPWL